jgi:hypothetical protein
MNSPFAPGPPRVINGECAGFVWIGQSFKYCDECGKPYWDHRYDMEIRRGRWFRKLISAAEAARVKGRWDT